MTFKTIIRYIFIAFLLSISLFFVFSEYLGSYFTIIKSDFLAYLPIEIKGFFVIIIFLVVYLVGESFT